MNSQNYLECIKVRLIKHCAYCGEAFWSYSIMQDTIPSIDFSGDSDFLDYCSDECFQADNKEE